MVIAATAGEPSAKVAACHFDLDASENALPRLRAVKG